MRADQGRLRRARRAERIIEEPRADEAARNTKSTRKSQHLLNVLSASRFPAIQAPHHIAESVRASAVPRVAQVQHETAAQPLQLGGLEETRRFLGDLLAPGTTTQGAAIPPGSFGTKRGAASGVLAAGGARTGRKGAAPRLSRKRAGCRSPWRRSSADDDRWVARSGPLEAGERARLREIAGELHAPGREGRASAMTGRRGATAGSRRGRARRHLGHPGVAGSWRRRCDHRHW